MYYKDIRKRGIYQSINKIKRTFNSFSTLLKVTLANGDIYKTIFPLSLSLEFLTFILWPRLPFKFSYTLLSFVIGYSRGKRRKKEKNKLEGKLTNRNRKVCQVCQHTKRDHTIKTIAYQSGELENGKRKTKQSHREDWEGIQVTTVDDAVGRSAFKIQQPHRAKGTKLPLDTAWTWL